MVLLYIFISSPVNFLAVFSLKARLQPFTVLFLFSVIFICLIDAQIHSFFQKNAKSTYFSEKMRGLSVNKTNKDHAEKKSTANGCKRALSHYFRQT